MDITDQQLYIDDDDFDWEIDTGAITQTSQQVQTDSSDNDWKITTTGSTTISGQSSNNSTTIKQGQISGGSGISVGSGSVSTGSISIGPDEEKVEKLRELAKEQLDKVEKLRDIVIDWIVAKTPSREKKIQWKRDLDVIGEYKRDLEDGLSEPANSGGIVWDEAIREEQTLDPSQLDKLNDIYRRWT